MTKYIFDFDDVLFFNTDGLKKYMYKCFEEIGVSHDIVKKYYKIEKEKGWTLHNLVTSVIKGENITSISKDELTEKIMKECKNFINNELINKIKLLEVNNCYLITHGISEYQLEKINRTGIERFFNKIIVVQDTKKEAVEKICEQFKNDKIIFIDDKEERFADIDFKKHSNLTTVLYTGLKSVDKILKN